MAVIADLGWNPEVLSVVADRLQRPAGLMTLLADEAQAQSE